MNPKDPPSIELCALLDTGANCNVISKRYEHLFNVSNNSKRRIRFATEENSQLASIRKGKFSIEYQELNLEFEAEFYSCDIVEDVILGNPFLKRTGIVFLCLEGAADNPFLPTIHNLQELVGDQDGECEEVDSVDELATSHCRIECSALHPHPQPPPWQP